MVQDSFTELSNYFVTNIEVGYEKMKQHRINANKGKYYSKRPNIIGRCREIDCNNPAIYSHSISKKAVLKNLASNGFVYTPSIVKDGIIMDSIGIKTQASVFPGFCKSHDAEFFSELDKTDNCEYSVKFFQQLVYRTVTREIFVKERSIRYSECMLDELEKGFQKT